MSAEFPKLFGSSRLRNGPHQLTIETLDRLARWNKTENGKKPVKLKDRRQDSRTLWRWKVMSPTSITTSLGNPVVQNLASTDAQIRDQRTASHQTGKRETKGIASLAMLGLWSWPPPPAAAAAPAPREPSPVRSSSSPASNNPFKSSNGEAFLGRKSCPWSWESGNWGELARYSQ